MNRRAAGTSERQLRIALLRAQAAVERELVVQHVAGMRQGISRYTSLGQRLSGDGIVGSLFRIWALARRHPIITSTASAWLLRGRSKRLLRLGGVAVLGWRVFQAWRQR